MLYELRTYKAAPDRMGALQARFREHTLGLFQRHGIENVAYWTTMVGGPSDELIYLLRYESMAARELAWRGFVADEEWRQVFRKSTEAAGGSLTLSTEARFLTPTNFSPGDHGGDPGGEAAPRLFEWRAYTASLDRMGELLRRFRDTTVAKFEEHGATNVGYWLNAVGGRNDELQYALAYRDMAHREQVWAAFGHDPEWLAVRAESNKDGNLVAHLSNSFLAPTDYSPLR